MNSTDTLVCDKFERTPKKVITQIFTPKSHCKIPNPNKVSDPRFQTQKRSLHPTITIIPEYHPLGSAHSGNKLLIFSWLGYLMDEPNALEFEDDEDELTADTDESESASVSNSDSEDDESSSDEITLGDLLQSGDIADDNNDDEDDDDEESGDDDWDPSKDNPKRRKQTKKEKKKKKKSKTEDSDEHNDGTTSKDFEQTEGTTRSEDGDDDHEPEKQIKSETKKETKRNKKKRKKLETEQPTVENGLTHPQKLKKKAKKTQLKSPGGIENTESVNSLQNNKGSENILPIPVNSLNSEKNDLSKKNERKTQNQVDLQQTSPEKRNNQSQATEVSILAL